MNDEDIKEHHNLIKQLDTYQPLPSGLTVADSLIAGQGLFPTRRLVMGTLLGISHYRIDGEYIRTPLGGFINHRGDANCVKVSLHANGTEPPHKRWNLVTIKDINIGDELTLRYTFYHI